MLTRLSQLLFVGLISATLAGCSLGGINDSSTTDQQANQIENTNSGDIQILTGEENENSEDLGESSYVSYDIDVFASGLEVPRSIALPEESTMYISERGGKIQKITNGNKELYYELDRVRAVQEAGLMGMALDPDYQNNHYIYLSVARDGQLQIVRYTDTGTGFESEHIIFDLLPVAQYHAGGAIAFGPDGKLYFSVGDATERTKAQDTTSYHGKLLRINPDGSIPEDNPFTGSAIRSYGHRNIQGIDRTEDGTLIVSEHGPTAGFDGKAGGDEVNIIQKGGNYGWPLVSHEESAEGLIDPLITYTPALAPSGMIIYTGELFPQRNGKILVAGLGGARIVVIDPNNGEEEEVLLNAEYGRLRAITQNTRGEIFVTTSNRDGRGTVQSGDDKILHITPQE